MTQKLDMKTPEIVAYELDEALTKEELEQIHRDLRQAIDDGESVRFFVDARHLSKVEPAALLEDLKLTSEYLNAIDRFAVIGANGWQSLLTAVTDKLSKGEARYFDPDHLDEAQAWVRAY